MRKRDFEVHMDRRTSMNACQNARKRVEYVAAHCEEEAKRTAEAKRPEFKAISARLIRCAVKPRPSDLSRSDI